MIDDSLIDATAAAFYDAIGVLAGAAPGGWAEKGERGTEILVSGAPMSGLNGVVTRGREPDVEEVARFAARLSGAGLPWSVQVRGEPTADILGIAAGYGLVDRRAVPMMVCTPDRAASGRAVPASGTVAVRRVGSGVREVFNDVAARGFEAPRDMFDALMSGPVLDAPGATAYLVEASGVPVATGYVVRTGDFAGVFNIATPPEHRGRGYGRLVTATILADAFAAGVTIAYLQPSGLAAKLYESMGFETVETWTYLEA